MVRATVVVVGSVDAFCARGLAQAMATGQEALFLTHTRLQEENLLQQGTIDALRKENEKLKESVARLNLEAAASNEEIRNLRQQARSSVLSPGPVLGSPKAMQLLSPSARNVRNLQIEVAALKNALNTYISDAGRREERRKGKQKSEIRRVQSKMRTKTDHRRKMSLRNSKLANRARERKRQQKLLEAERERVTRNQILDEWERRDRRRENLRRREHDQYLVRRARSMQILQEEGLARIYTET